MNARLGLRLVALALPVALLAPGAAHARSLTVADSTGDAKALNMALVFGELIDGTEGEGAFFLDAPAETSADVVSTTIDHAAKRLTLTLQFRDLVEVKGHSVDFRIFTPDGRFDLSARAVGEGTEVYFSPAGRNVVIVSNGGSYSGVGPDLKPCRTVRARYDVAVDTLTASVPTACLGRPTWVQVAAGVSRSKLTPLGDGSANIATFADDAFRGGISMRSIGRSPKVRRG